MAIQTLDVYPSGEHASLVGNWVAAGLTPLPTAVLAVNTGPPYRNYLERATFATGSHFFTTLPAGVPAGATDISVAVHAVLKSDDSTPALVKLHTVKDDGAGTLSSGSASADIPLTTDWVAYVFDVGTQNVVSSLPWTVDDINQESSAKLRGCGVTFAGLAVGMYVRCGQLFLRITYTEPETYTVVRFETGKVPELIITGTTALHIDDPDALIDPDLTAVAGLPVKYWKRVADTVVAMSGGEQTAADAAIAAAVDAAADIRFPLDRAIEDVEVDFSDYLIGPPHTPEEETAQILSLTDTVRQCVRRLIEIDPYFNT